MRTKHGHATGRRGHTRVTPEYEAWKSMLARCERPSADRYECYGGRGIRVCDAWHKFEAFLADVGLRPSDEYSIGRIDNDGHYEPGNVRWETRGDQARNKSNNRQLTHEGRTMCIAAWAEIVGIESARIASRLHRGWSVSDALTRPKRITTQTKLAVSA